MDADLTRMGTTRRFPRSLHEAFGPYTSSEIESEPLGWRVCDAVVAAMLVGVLAAIAAGVFS